MGELRGSVQALSSSGVLAFSRQTGLLLFAIGLLNASNYLFHVVVSRPLGPSDYGALAALLAVLLVLSVPFGVLQTVVAERTAALRVEGRLGDITRFAAVTTRGVLPIALAAALTTLVVGAPILAVFLEVSFASSSLLAPYVLLATLAAIPLGVLQGTMRFGAFAVIVLSGVAVRLGTGFGLVELGFGVTGAMLASSLATAVILFLGLAVTGLLRGWLGTGGSLEAIRGEFGLALLALVSFLLLTQADVALARHFLDADEAGFYSSGGLLARTLLFMPAAVALVAFPRFVEARERGEGALHWLRTSLFFGGAVVLAGFLFLVAARDFVVELTFGASFAPAAALLPLLCLAMAAFALVGVLTYFHIALGSRAYLFAFGGLATEVILVALFHGTPMQIATVVAGVGVAVACLQFAAAWSLCRWRPPLGWLAPPPGAPALLGSEPAVELSVVIPCHNASVGLRRLLEELVDELELLDSYEIIVVSDGSTDETVCVAEEFPSDSLRVLHYPRRSGKGHALQVGFTEARGRYVAFVDGDGDVGAEAIRPFLTIMKLYEPDVVLGSKRHPLSEVYYPPLRRFMSWAYHKLARLLFRVNVRDTQTGLKLVRRNVLADVLPRLFEKRYAFDLEFLVVARSLGYKRVFEAPVRIDYKFGSQVSPLAVFRILLDTAAIFYRHYILGAYRAERQTVVAAPASEAPAAVFAHTGRTSAGAFRSPSRRNGCLRILFLNWRDLASPSAEGAESFAREVARRWVAHGHEVSLLTSGSPGSATAATEEGVQIHRVGRLGARSFYVVAQRELERLPELDVVVDAVTTIPPVAAAWRRWLPLTVALVHQLPSQTATLETQGGNVGVGPWADERLPQHDAEVPTVAVSHSTAEALAAVGFKNVVVIPPGREEPPSLGMIKRQPQPTFLFAGALEANKRPDHAVEAFRQLRKLLPDARLWIAGKGALEPDVASERPPGAELLGSLSREELYGRMARAHCLLVTSVCEAWGNVVIEANSVGTPAVAYDVPGLRDSVQHGSTGLLAQDGDAAALARHALAMVEDPVLHQTMSRKASAWAQNFSWDETASSLLRVIEEWRARSLQAHSRRSG